MQRHTHFPIAMLVPLIVILAACSKSEPAPSPSPVVSPSPLPPLIAETPAAVTLHPSAPPADIPASWTLIRREGFSIGLPAGWHTYNVAGNFYTLSASRGLRAIGMTMQKEPPFPSTAEGAKALAESLDHTCTLDLGERVRDEPVRLPATDAWLSVAIESVHGLTFEHTYVFIPGQPRSYCLEFDNYAGADKPGEISSIAGSFRFSGNAM